MPSSTTSTSSPTRRPSHLATAITFLHQAARLGDLPRAQDILKKYPFAALPTAADTLTPLHTAIEAKTTPIAALIIQHLHTGGPDLSNRVLNAQDADGNTALMLAVKKANVSGLKVLLDAGADTELANHASVTPVVEALTVDRPRKEIYEMMLFHTASSQARDGVIAGRGSYDTALHDAAGKGLVELVQLLLDLGADQGCR